MNRTCLENMIVFTESNTADNYHTLGIIGFTDDKTDKLCRLLFSSLVFIHYTDKCTNKENA